MATAISQDKQRQALSRQTREHMTRIEGLRSLSADQLAWTPPEGGWGVAHVLEHLVITNDNYLPMMDRLTREASVGAQPGDGWKPSLAGGLLIKSMTSPRRFKTPKLFSDVMHPRDNVVAAFTDQLRRIESLLEAADRVSWRHTRTASPVSRLIPLNLGDCFTVLPAHNERHLGQIDRVMSHTRFPAGSESGHPTPS
jgi:hypothetical protein